MAHIVPAVPHVANKSGTSTPNSPLNPIASSFSVSPTKKDTRLSLPMKESASHPLPGNSSADHSMDQTIEHMAKVQIVGFGDDGLKLKDIIDPRESPIVEGVRYDPVASVVVLTCDTNNLQDPYTGNQFIANLIDSGMVPTQVQLNIMAESQLPFLLKATKWFRNTLGQFMVNLELVQIVIIRSGELTDNKWIMTELDLEKSKPLTEMVISILQSLPPTVKVVWGSSEQNNLALRSYYYSKADKNALAALEDHDDKSIQAYSQVLNGTILAKIAKAHAGLLGKQFGGDGDYPLNPTEPSLRGSGSSLRASRLNPEAPSFQFPHVPALPPFMTYVPFFPRDPFQKQMFEVDQHRSDWYPNSFGGGLQLPISPAQVPGTMFPASTFYPTGIQRVSAPSLYAPVEPINSNQVHYQFAGPTLYSITPPSRDDDVTPIYATEAKFAKNYAKKGNKQPVGNMEGTTYFNSSFDSRSNRGRPRGQHARDYKNIDSDNVFYEDVPNYHSSRNVRYDREVFQSGFPGPIVMPDDNFNSNAMRGINFSTPSQGQVRDEHEGLTFRPYDPNDVYFPTSGDDNGYGVRTGSKFNKKRRNKSRRAGPSTQTENNLASGNSADWNTPKSSLLQGPLPTVYEAQDYVHVNDPQVKNGTPVLTSFWSENKTPRDKADDNSRPEAASGKW